MISDLNEQLQQELEYTLLKRDCHSWWISKMQSDTLEERYAIKFCFKLGKIVTEMYGMFQTFATANTYAPPWGLSTLAKELSAAASVMQSSS